MNCRITIQEALTEWETERFWQQLRLYQARDLFPDPASEERAYFLGEGYRAAIEKLHDQPQDRCRYLFFCRDGQEVGFALPMLRLAGDGNCFIMEFCIYPGLRGRGVGRACAAALLAWARERGAAYAELNCGGPERRLRFWKSVGFLPNGRTSGASR